MNLYCAHPVIDADIYRLLGKDIPRLLREGNAQEISVNADGRIHIDDGGPWEYLIDADPIPLPSSRPRSGSSPQRTTSGSIPTPPSSIPCWRAAPASAPAPRRFLTASSSPSGPTPASSGR